MTIQNIINVDENVQFGTPVFTGTRVPVETLFWHLEDGASIDDFLEDFPTVSREQAVALLDFLEKTLASPVQIKKFYEIAA
jgi:uncharacterized protein (DUF433 family)